MDDGGFCFIWRDFSFDLTSNWVQFRVNTRNSFRKDKISRILLEDTMH